MSEHDALLGIYMNDHLAGATAGLELFRRAAGSAAGPVKAELGRLTAEVAQDRDSLLSVMRGLGIPVQRYKALAGWMLERISRLKTNGRLLRRSPLSDLVELEALVLGVQGKAAGFRALRTVAAAHPRLEVAELDRLIDRAERQAQALERLRLLAAAHALAGPVSPAGGPS